MGKFSRHGTTWTIQKMEKGQQIHVQKRGELQRSGRSSICTKTFLPDFLVRPFSVFVQTAHISLFEHAHRLHSEVGWRESPLEWWRGGGAAAMG
jgi:hypothetical protein